MAGANSEPWWFPVLQEYSACESELDPLCIPGRGDTAAGAATGGTLVITNLVIQGADTIRCIIEADQQTGFIRKRMCIASEGLVSYRLGSVDAEVDPAQFKIDEDLIYDPRDTVKFRMHAAHMGVTLEEAATPGLFRVTKIEEGAVGEHPGLQVGKYISGSPLKGATNYTGIGIILGLRGSDGKAEVRCVVPGSPAADGGVVEGDEIAVVDGAATEGLSLEAVRALLTRPIGTSVALELRRKGQVVNVSLERREFELKQKPSVNREDDP